MISRRAALALALLATFALSASAQPNPRAPEPPTKIEVRARAISAFEPGNPLRTRFGALTFRGGLELTSSHQHFGGISCVRPASIAYLSIASSGFTGYFPVQHAVQ